MSHFSSAFRVGKTAHKSQKLPIALFQMSDPSTNTANNTVDVIKFGYKIHLEGVHEAGGCNVYMIPEELDQNTQSEKDILLDSTSNSCAASTNNKPSGLEHSTDCKSVTRNAVGRRDRRPDNDELAVQTSGQASIPQKQLSCFNIVGGVPRGQREAEWGSVDEEERQWNLWGEAAGLWSTDQAKGPQAHTTDTCGCERDERLSSARK